MLRSLHQHISSYSLHHSKHILTNKPLQLYHALTNIQNELQTQFKISAPSTTVTTTTTKTTPTRYFATSTANDKPSSSTNVKTSSTNQPSNWQHRSHHLEQLLQVQSEQQRVSTGLAVTISSNYNQTQNDTLVVLVTKNDLSNGKHWQQLSNYSLQLPTHHEIVDQDFQAQLGQTQVVYLSSTSQNDRVTRVLLVGLGEGKNIALNSIRSAVHHSLSALQRLRVVQASFLLPLSLAGDSLNKVDGQIEATETDHFNTEQLLHAISRTAVLSHHNFDKYLHSTADKKKVHLKKIEYILPATSTIDLQNAQHHINRGVTIAEGTTLARELSNEQADVCNPDFLEQVALDIASKHGDVITCSVVKGEELIKRGYHLLASVGQAAKSGPRLVVLNYRGNPSSHDTTALIGKGITFDSGGLNLKPTGSIETMHHDMSGCAAVIATVKTLARSRLPVNVVACVALAENAIDSLSYKPHAIIPSQAGTIEIGNTDAEGRLALADAFTHVQNEYQVSRMIDLATLTGACVVALGESLAGLFTNNRQLANSLIQAGDSCFERCWHMPIMAEHTAELRGRVSDYRSTGPRYGGACTAAAFLKLFVKDKLPWAHLDIAGPAMYSKPREFMPQGGTGFGVQLLVDYLDQLSKANHSTSSSTSKK